MPSEDHLFELIKSLAPTEKRYFKVFAGLHGGRSKNNYVELFELLDRQDVYDEEAVRRGLSNRTFARNLPTGKHYLYNLLLRGLRLYHAERRALFQVHELIMDVHILIEKSLTQQALKRIQRAKKLAARYHFDLLMIEVLQLERMIIRGYATRHSREQIDENQQELRRYLRQVDIQIDILELYDDIFLILRNRPLFERPEERIHHLIEQFSAKVSLADFSFETRMIYHLIWSNYYTQLTGEPARARHHLGVLVDLFEEERQLIDEYPTRYINLLNNYLNTWYLENNFAEFPAVIEKMEAVRPDSKLLRMKLFQKIYYFKLLAYLRLRQFDRALALLPGVESGLVEYGEGIGRAQMLAFFQIIALTYFYNGRPDDALAWLDRVINEQRHEVRQDIQVFCRVLQLILHYELENYDLAGSLAQSIVRQVRRADDGESFIRLVAGGIAKAIDAPAAERAPVFRRMKARLERESGYANGREEVLYWLEGKTG